MKNAKVGDFVRDRIYGGTIFEVVALTRKMEFHIRPLGDPVSISKMVYKEGYDVLTASDIEREAELAVAEAARAMRISEKLLNKRQELKRAQ